MDQQGYKMCSTYHSISRKCKLMPVLYFTAYTPEWLKLRCIGKDMEQVQLCCIAGGSVYWRTVWQYLLKLNICLPHDTARCLSERNKYMYPPKNMCKNVHGSFLYKSPKLESIQISTSKRIDKLIVVYPHSGILLSNIKEGN